MALASAAIRGCAEPVPVERVRQGFLFLVWTLRREFILDPMGSATEVLEQALDSLCQYGAIAREADGLRVIDTERIGEIYALLRPVLEAYGLVLGSEEALGAASSGKATKL